MAAQNIYLNMMNCRGKKQIKGGAAAVAEVVVAVVAVAAVTAGEVMVEI